VTVASLKPDLILDCGSFSFFFAILTSLLIHKGCKRLRQRVYPSLAKRMFEHFEQHWLEAAPYLPSKKGTSYIGHQAHAAVGHDEPKRQICY
jgi:hypothetical protein